MSDSLILHAATFTPDLPPNLHTGAFAQGVKAFREGISLHDCPIEKYTRQWNQWRMGWCSENRKQEERDLAGLPARSERIWTGDWK